MTELLAGVILVAGACVATVSVLGWALVTLDAWIADLKHAWRYPR